jgi:hypothetical protein
MIFLKMKLLKIAKYYCMTDVCYEKYCYKEYSEH